MTVKVFIEDMQVTLFSDEGISITSSVLDIEDITVNTTDYSKTFTVPANENNNWIFKHYYNANIDNLFDARITHSGRIELDNFVFRTGKFVLRSVNVKKGVASSYTINFWGNLVSLKDLIGDDYLSDLDLSDYDHNYRPSTVQAGLIGDLSGGNIVYTLMPKKKYYYDSTETLTERGTEYQNIAWTGSSGENGVWWNEIKPSLKIIRIIETIESKYGITFSREFFGTTAFTELWLWLNDDAEGSGMAGKPTSINWTSGNSPYVPFAYPTTTFIYPTENNPPDPQTVSFTVDVTIIPASGFENVSYTVTQIQEGAVVVAGKTMKGTGVLNGAVLYPYSDTQFQVTADEAFEFTASLSERIYTNGVAGNIYSSQASLQEVDSYFTVEKNIPKIKTIDFLRGIFQAFKLVIIPLSTGEIYVNTLTGYYASGELLDISRYVDSSKLTVNRGNILSEIDYGFSEPTTITNQKFEENNKKAYGDEELLLQNDDNQLLQGETANIELPFEIILFERLNDESDGSSTNIQTGAIVDRDLKTVNPKPVIHYVSNQSVAGKSVAFENETSKSELNVSMNIPMHSTFASGTNQPSDVFLFSQEFSTWNGQRMDNTLYAKYHADYIADIFNPKRRNYDLRAILPLRALLRITLNDIIKIGENYFRIDNFTINTLTGETQLKLFNSVNISFIGFSASPTNISLSKDAQTYTGYVFNLIPYTSQKIDVGFGTNWLTVTDTEVTSSIHFTVTENLGQNRTMQVKLISTTTLEEILFTVTQSLDNIGSTVDSTIITVDNSQITI